MDLIAIDRVAGWSRGREIAEIDRPRENDIARGKKIKTTETSFFSSSSSSFKNSQKETVPRGGKRALRRRVCVCMCVCVRVFL